MKENIETLFFVKKPRFIFDEQISLADRDTFTAIMFSDGWRCLTQHCTFVLIKLMRTMMLYLWYQEQNDWRVSAHVSLENPCQLKEFSKKV